MHARRRSLALTFGAAAVALAIAAPALADDQGASVGVYVEGTKSDAVEDAIARALPTGISSASDDAVKKALKDAGVHLPLAASITGKDAKTTFAKIGKAAHNLDVKGIAIGVTKGKDVEIFFIESDASTAAVDTTTASDSALDESVKSALAPELDKWKPAPVEEPKKDDAPAAPAPTEEKPGRPKNTHGREIVNAFVGFDLGGRFFNYTDPISSNLRDYSVFGTPGIALSAEVYPLAGLDVPVVQGLGVVGDFRVALALGSETKDGTKIDTSSNRFDVGLRFRQPLAKQVNPGDKAVVLGLKGTFGRDSFLMTAPGELGQEAPSVEYFLLRAGLDGSFPAGPLILGLSFGYDGALSAGDVYSRNRGSKIGGIDVGGGITVPIALGFEGRLTAEYIRWFYSFSPRADDKYVAGGALDQYVHLELGPAYVF